MLNEGIMLFEETYALIVCICNGKGMVAAMPNLIF